MPQWQASQVTPPVSEPLLVAAVKDQSRVDFTDDDAYLGTLIAAARDWFELRTGRQLVRATWNLWLDGFPTGNDPRPGSYGVVRGGQLPAAFPQSLYRDGRFWIPRPPLWQVNSVTYVDATGATRTLTANVDYIVSGQKDPAFIAPAYGRPWPVARPQLQAVQIAFDSGYAAIPPLALLAMKAAVSYWYKFREPVLSGTIMAPLPNHMESMIGSFKTGVYNPGEYK